MSIERIGNTLATATPLIFTGLSVAFAFKTGLFNIGAAGQMLFGGFCATAIGLSLNLPKTIVINDYDNGRNYWGCSVGNSARFV